MLKFRLTTLAACAAVATLCVHQPSFAQDAPVQAKPVQKKEDKPSAKGKSDFELRLNLPRVGSGEAIENELEAERLKTLKGQAKPTGKVPGEPEKAKELNQEVENIDKQLGKTKRKIAKAKSEFKKRRSQQMREVKKRYGSLFKQPAAKRALEEHAQKLAKLKRIRFLALEARNPEALGRAELLLTAERYLVKRRMELVELRAKPQELFLPQYSPAKDTAKDESEEQDKPKAKADRADSAKATKPKSVPAPAPATPAQGE